MDEEIEISAIELKLGMHVTGMSRLGKDGARRPIVKKTAGKWPYVIDVDFAEEQGATVVYLQLSVPAGHSIELDPSEKVSVTAQSRRCAEGEV